MHCKLSWVCFMTILQERQSTYSVNCISSSVEYGVQPLAAALYVLLEKV